MKKSENRGILMYWKRSAACALILMLLLGGCGRSSKNSAMEEMGSADRASYSSGGTGVEYAAAESFAESDSEDFDEEPMETFEGSGDDFLPNGDEGGGEAADLKSDNRKIIYTGNISLQTLEYDKSSKSIHDKINQYGGFIESEDTFNEDPYWYYKNRPSTSSGKRRRNLNVTARVPAEQFEAFMKDLENDGQVINTSVNARNISVQYATHDASKKALEIEQSRLLEMMDKAETIEEMIAVEERLTEVERELNDEKTQLSAMDRDVGFSTVHISLEEVFEYSEQVVEVTYWERLKKAFGRAIEGFVEFWEDLSLAIAETFPFLIMLGIIIFVIVKFIRRGRRRKKEKLEKIRESQRLAAGYPQRNEFSGHPGMDRPADLPQPPVSAPNPPQPPVSAGDPVQEPAAETPEKQDSGEAGKE